MIKAVIDTNVLVSAIWSSNGTPAVIVERMFSKEFEPVKVAGNLIRLLFG